MTNLLLIHSNLLDVGNMNLLQLFQLQNSSSRGQSRSWSDFAYSSRISTDQGKGTEFSKLCAIGFKADLQSEFLFFDLFYIQKPLMLVMQK